MKVNGKLNYQLCFQRKMERFIIAQIEKLQIYPSMHLFSKNSVFLPSPAHTRVTPAGWENFGHYYSFPTGYNLKYNSL